MISTKQRAFLRALAAGLTPVTQVGKNGITDCLIKTVSDALEAHELVKLTVLETCPASPREVCDTLCAALGSDPVQVIGRKVSLYRRASDPEKRTLVLPR